MLHLWAGGTRFGVWFQQHTKALAGCSNDKEVLRFTAWILSRTWQWISGKDHKGETVSPANKAASAFKAYSKLFSRTLSLWNLPPPDSLRIWFALIPDAESVFHDPHFLLLTLNSTLGDLRQKPYRYLHCNLHSAQHSSTRLKYIDYHYKKPLRCGDLLMMEPVIFAQDNILVIDIQHWTCLYSLVYCLYSWSIFSMKTDLKK